MNSNLSKVFSDIVSVDAWRADFDDQGRANVHVDLSFLLGEIGAEDEFEITFRVALRRAVLKLVVPPNEPLAIIQASVDREPTLEGIKKILQESQTAQDTQADLSARFAKGSIAAEAKGRASVRAARSKSTTIEFSQKITEFRVRQFIDGAGNYCWEVTPHDAIFMNGKVWNPVKEPRLSIKQTSASKLPPVLEAHVLCRRSDIEIQDVKAKKNSTFH